VSFSWYAVSDDVISKSVFLVILCTFFTETLTLNFTAYYLVQTQIIRYFKRRFLIQNNINYQTNPNTFPVKSNENKQVLVPVYTRQHFTRTPAYIQGLAYIKHLNP